MPLLILLPAAVLAYLWWRWRTTTLTRDCRWREDRGSGTWHCTYCGERTENGPPRACLRSQQ